MFISKKPKIGIAFGGGGTRGFAHLGVVKALEEFGIKFDVVAGTSAGSIMGAFYAAGYNFKQMYDIAKNIREKDIRTNIIPFAPSKTDGIGDIVTKALGDINIEDLKLPFAAVAVDIKSTKQVAITKGNLAKAVMGSCAIPAVFQPVDFEGMLLCDGGLQNTIPTDIPLLMGCDYVVSIDVNKSRLYGTESTKLMDVVMCSIRILMQSNAVRGYINADVMIAPETKRFSSKSTEGLDEMIDEGYKAAIDAMPQIIQLFGKHKRLRARKLPRDVQIIK